MYGLVYELLIFFSGSGQKKRICNRSGAFWNARDDVGTSHPVRFCEISLRPLCGMIGMRVVKANDVQVAPSCLPLDADQFLGSDVVTVVRTICARVSCAFNRNDAVELSWQILEPVLESWHATRSVSSFPNYAAGTWGPADADALLSRDGRAWKNTSVLPRFYLTDPDS